MIDSLAFFHGLSESSSHNINISVFCRHSPMERGNNWAISQRDHFPLQWSILFNRSQSQNVQIAFGNLKKMKKRLA